MKWVYLIKLVSNYNIVHSLEIWKNKRWNPGLLILDHIKQLHSIISPPTTGTI